MGCYCSFCRQIRSDKIEMGLRVDRLVEEMKCTRESFALVLRRLRHVEDAIRELQKPFKEKMTRRIVRELTARLPGWILRELRRVLGDVYGRDDE